MQQQRLTCVRSRPWRSSQGERAAPSSLDSVLSTLLTLTTELAFLRRFKECNLVGGRAVIPEWTRACAEGAHSRKTPGASRTILLVERQQISAPSEFLAVCSASSDSKDILLFLGFGSYVHRNTNLSLCIGGGCVHFLSASKPIFALNAQGSGVGCLWLAYFVGSHGSLRTGRLEASRFSVRACVSDGWGEQGGRTEWTARARAQAYLFRFSWKGVFLFSRRRKRSGATLAVALPLPRCLPAPFHVSPGRRGERSQPGSRTSDRQFFFWSHWSHFLLGSSKENIFFYCQVLSLRQ